MKNEKILVLFCALFLLVANGFAQSENQDLAAKVDEYMNAFVKAKNVGGAVLVAKDGKILVSRGYGLANVELNVPNGANTKFRIGSLTKQFTSAAVMILQERGKLSVRDAACKYLDDCPEAWKAVTIHQLLTHTSGIPSFTAIQEWKTKRVLSLTPAETLALVRDAPLKFKPGEDYEYSNTGYYLLGIIVERASGKNYWQFLDERIFKPLKMNSTRNTDRRLIVANRAAGYGWIGDRWENRPALAPFVAFSAGSLLSTVEDLAKWDAALYTEKLLKKSSLERMWTPAKTNTGEAAAVDYGFGWFVEKYRGRRDILHSGGTPGFSSVMHRFSDDRLSVIILTNHADIILEQMALEIAGMYQPKLKYNEPAVDPNAPQTARMRQIFFGLFEGRFDSEAFTPAMNTHLKTATGKSFFGWYASMGAIESFNFLERETSDGLSVLRYRVRLGESAFRFSFKITNDGKIAQIYCW